MGIKLIFHVNFTVQKIFMQPNCQVFCCMYDVLPMKVAALWNLHEISVNLHGLRVHVKFDFFLLKIFNPCKVIMHACGLVCSSTLTYV